MVKEVVKVREDNQKISEMSINIVAKTTENAKKLLDLQDSIALLAEEIAGMHQFSEKFKIYKFEIFQKTQLMEAHWIPLLDYVKKGEKG